MRKLSISTLALAVAVGAFSFAGISPAEAQSKKKFISIGTGGPTGVYFVVGQSVCRMVHKAAAEGRKSGRKHGIRCSAPSTGGSNYNIGQIKEGELDFGVAQSDWQFHAYNGSSKYKGKAYKKLRAVFSVHPEPYHIIVGGNSGIKSWADLKGKRFNLGNPGSGQRGTTEVLMKKYGTKKSDFKIATELTSTEQSKALCDGKIDAYGYTVGVPNAGVSVATDGCGAKIINLETSVEKGLVDANPYYAFATIPKGTYKTTDADVTTFGVMATFVTSADVDDNVVYEVVRAVFENLDDFRTLHPAFKNLDPKLMIKNALSAPLHPGAVKYYKEKGWM
ncbi:MAG: TAXI family TRAP transporter solute-binding subunit [Proteobacteria bacterium]|nr:TAXI family TRAP transporter solute-binding subunit [Pseudomonadota bacterium]MDA1022355.1 TAXI family TRAP transporter solute-binding subunit [Pseudomonadota bacterium]